MKLISRTSNRASGLDDAPHLPSDLTLRDADDVVEEVTVPDEIVRSLLSKRVVTRAALSVL